MLLELTLSRISGIKPRKKGLNASISTELALSLS